jgi:ATP-dependent Clp protease ATP-binding subunit ClpA
MGPFDRFNDRAKRVLALAQDEAIRLHHNYIGPEHLLLGLVREGEGVAARVLDSLGVELSKLRTAAEVLIGRGDATTTPSEITLMPRTKKIIELAIDEARKLGHSHVGTEHLLLGLAREAETIASGVLASLGVSLEKVRHQVIATLGQQPPPSAQTVPGWTAPVGGPGGHVAPVDRLDAQSSHALARAYWEAGRLNHAEVGQAHLLLALLAPDSLWIRRVLGQLRIDVEAVATKLVAAVPAREGPRAEAVSESVGLGEAIARAWSFAIDRNSPRIRVEHLLLAIAADVSPAAQVLAAAGATPEVLRDVIDRLSG